MFSVLVDRHLTAVEVGDVLQFLEIRMRVAAKNKVDAARLCKDIIVAFRQPDKFLLRTAVPSEV